MQRSEISNLILSKLGEDDQVTDPDEDGKAARSINAVWNSVRDTALRLHTWNFAGARKQLTPLAGAPAHGFSYAFQLPPDFIRLDLEKLRPLSVRRDFQLEGTRNILANELGPIDLAYIRRVEEEGDWDPLFVEAFASRLAWQIAIKVTGDKQIQRGAWQEYVAALREAKAVDGRENPSEPPVDSSWVTARDDGGPVSEAGW